MEKTIRALEARILRADAALQSGLKNIVSAVDAALTKAENDAAACFSGLCIVAVVLLLVLSLGIALTNHG